MCRSIEDAADRAYSHVVVTTKAVPDVLRTPDLLKTFLTAPYIDSYEQPTYVLLQNGLNVEVDLYKAVKALGKGEPKVVGSGVYINANLVDTNVVEHSDFVRPCFVHLVNFNIY